jgi:AcrR family transcriptional regulator/DNA-binding MarR family transcriptional regulator
VEEIERTRILRAMTEAVARGDVHSVTVAQVLARAGVSRARFDEEFGDLEGCFLAAFEWGVRRGRAVMAEAFAGESTWADRIRAALAALLLELEQEPTLARLWIVHSLGGGPRVLRRRAAVIAALCEYVDRGRAGDIARMEPPKLTAEGVVGGVLAILQAGLLAEDPEPLTELQGQLMHLILLPYLGAATAARELRRPVSSPRKPRRSGRAAVQRTGGTLTDRTARVLAAIAECPGASNREISEWAGIVDQGQISRLLSRLESLGLVVNVGGRGQGGAPNAWTLTPRGQQAEGDVRRINLPGPARPARAPHRRGWPPSRP